MSQRNFEIIITGYENGNSPDMDGLVNILLESAVRSRTGNKALVESNDDGKPSKLKIRKAIVKLIGSTLPDISLTPLRFSIDLGKSKSLQEGRVRVTSKNYRKIMGIIVFSITSI